MKKQIFLFLSLFIVAMSSMAKKVEPTNDTIRQYTLDEVAVTSLYRNNITTGSELSLAALKSENHGQGIDYVFAKMPNIYAYNDNGTHMGYCYFRLRGMGQERMNVTLDGMPWNEAEDFGCYFSNSPDLMSSMHSVKVERGASVTTNGTAAYAGNVSLESADLKKDKDSYVDIGGGSFASFRTTAVYNMGQKGHWGLHIRATQQQTDGYKENAYNNAQALTAKVGYFFNDNHSIDLLTMTGYHRNGQGFMGITEDMLPKHPTPFKQMISGNREQETDNFLTTYNRLQYKGKLSDNTFFTSAIYWQHQNGDYRIGWEDETAPSGKVLNNYNLRYDMYGVNTVVKYYPISNLSIIGGVNAYMFNRRHKGYDIANTDTVINHWSAKGVDTYYDNYGNKPDVNVFTTVKWTPFNKFNISGSLQYRHTALDYNVNKAYMFDPNNDTSFNHHWNFINYGFNVDYKLTNTSKIYARYAVTNREPSRTDLFCAEYKSVESEMNTDNERVHDVELGYELRNKFINFNANFFYMNFKNELVATGELSPMNFLPIHKQHDAYRTGLEFAIDMQPIDKLHIIANFAWSVNKLKNVNGFTKTHTFSPDKTCFAEVNYEVNKVKFGVNTNYRSSVYMDIENKFTLKDLFTLGAYVNARLNKTFEVSLNMDNLTNRLNISNGSTDGTNAYYLVDSPFNFFASCKIHF